MEQTISLRRIILPRKNSSFLDMERPASCKTSPENVKAPRRRHNKATTGRLQKRRSVDQ
jgi:hypothetical protein